MDSYTGGMYRGWTGGTCYAAPIRHSHGTEAVVGHGSDLSCTPRTVVVAILHIRVGHGVRVVRVEVIAALGALKQGGGTGGACGHSLVTRVQVLELRERGELGFGGSKPAPWVHLCKPHGL